jgi:Fur family ferric uptake transcriptional regulator
VLDQPEAGGDGLQTLRANGLRVTAPRLAVLAAARAGNHATVGDIAGAAREQIGSISIQAVYDALAALERAGLVARIAPAGSPARFETRVGDNHHHVVCRSCGAVADIECATGEAPCLQAQASDGFVIDQADVTYWGLCRDCQRSTAGGLHATNLQGAKQ